MLEVVHKGLGAALELGVARYIVRDGEGVVPGAAFVEARGVGEIGPVFRIERGEETAVLHTGTEALVGRAPVVLVAQGTLVEAVGIGLSAQVCRQAGERIIGHIILQGVGDGVVSGEVGTEIIKGNIAQLHVRVVVRTHQVPGARGIGTLEESLVGRLDVEVPQAAEPRVGDHADGGVSFHGPGFAAVKLPLGHPAPFAVLVNHRTDHIGLLLGPEEGHKLMQVAVGVPEGIHGVTRMAWLYPANAAALHQGIAAVHVVEYVGMQEGVVQGGVEDGALVVGAAFDGYTAQVVVPVFIGLLADLVKGEALLLGFQVLPGAFDAYEGYAHLHLDLLSGLQVLVVEPVANVVSAELAAVVGVDLILAGIGVPGGFGRHRALLFPVTGAGGGLAHAHHEVHREHGVPVVAEGAHQLEAFDLRGRNLPYRSAALVGEAFAQVQEDVTLTAGEGVALQGGAEGGGGFGLDAVQKFNAIVTGMSHLIAVLATIYMIVYLQRPGGGHGEKRSQFRAAHTGKVHVREAGEETVLSHIRGAPPAAVLVPRVQLRAHHVERAHAHKPVGHHGAGIARAKVGRANERVHPLGLGV